MKKILITHFRVGNTDGVSLEIEKRKRVLEKMGFKVKLCSGPISVNPDYIIPELEFTLPSIEKIRNNAFLEFKDYSSLEEFKKDFYKISQIIESKFYSILKKEKFSLLMIHNILSHGTNLPATLGFYNVIKKLKIPTIATHHDFYWEREYYLNPTCGFIKKFLTHNVPPRLPHLKHVVINSITQEKLRRKRNIKAFIIPDTFDFSQKPWIKDKYNKDFLTRFKIRKNDIFVLQATRIAPRKAIEVAIDLVNLLNRPLFLNKIRNTTLFNGKKTDSKTKFILFIAGYAEKYALEYYKKLKEKASLSPSRIIFAHQFIKASRYKEKNKKFYSLWDSYVFSDFITYPSIWEGWGNQFIEAVFAQKPIVAFEYPVFRKDIKPKGYKIISLGSRFKKDRQGFVKIDQRKLYKAAQEVINILLNKKKAQKLIRDNYRIGVKNNSFLILESKLKKIISNTLPKSYCA